MQHNNAKTLEDVSRDLGIEKGAAYDLIRYLLKTGGARKVGSVRIPGRRGRGKHLYEFTSTVTENLGTVAATLAKAA